jgi:hypothetical protein
MGTITAPETRYFHPHFLPKNSPGMRQITDAGYLAL